MIGKSQKRSYKQMKRVFFSVFGAATAHCPEKPLLWQILVRGLHFTLGIRTVALANYLDVPPV